MTRRGVAALAAGLLVLTACGDPSSGPAAEPIPGRVGLEVSGTAVHVQLPHGRIDFEVGVPGDLDPSDLLDPEDGSDARVVPISWTFTPGSGIDPLHAGLALAQDVEAEVALDVDGDRVPLGDAYSVPGGKAAQTEWFVPVADGVEASDLAVAVSFDGAEQSVDIVGDGRETGPAEALYADEITKADMTCAAEVDEDVIEADVQCVAGAVSLPWHQGVGWAPEAGSWWFVDVTTTVTDVHDRAGGRYEVRSMARSDSATARVAEEFSPSRSQMRTLDVYSGPRDEPPTVSLTDEVTLTATEAGERDGTFEVVLSGQATPG